VDHRCQDSPLARGEQCRTSPHLGEDSAAADGTAPQIDTVLVDGRFCTVAAIQSASMPAPRQRTSGARVEVDRQAAARAMHASLRRGAMWLGQLPSGVFGGGRRRRRIEQRSGLRPACGWYHCLLSNSRACAASSADAAAPACATVNIRVHLVNMAARGSSRAPSGGACPALSYAALYRLLGRIRTVNR
jgi:hypothetical protein